MVTEWAGCWHFAQETSRRTASCSGWCGTARTCSCARPRRPRRASRRLVRRRGWAQARPVHGRLRRARETQFSLGEARRGWRAARTFGGWASTSNRASPKPSIPCEALTH